jgi:hypothetical protein
MTKKHFIALADAIREHNSNSAHTPFNTEHLDTLCAFMRSQNGAFMRDRWIGYALGWNGKNGGAVKTDPRDRYTQEPSCNW